MKKEKKKHGRRKMSSVVVVYIFLSFFLDFKTSYNYIFTHVS